MSLDARKEYADIIDLEHYVDPFRPQMPRLNRAAQFSPFAALAGYEDLIDETARYTGTQIELDDSAKEEIGRRMQSLLRLTDPPPVDVTYFIRDGKKTGGSYETVSGVIVKYNELTRELTLDSGLDIPIEAVIKIESGIFDT